MSSELVILVVLVSTLILLLAIGGWLVVKDTKRKEGKWGINFLAIPTPFRRKVKLLTCPVCNTSLLATRKPADLHETLWGGWTCTHCNTKLNKWGEVRET